MSIQLETIQSIETANAEVDRLTRLHRGSCLWWMRKDYLPQSLPERLRVLDSLERRADRVLFIQVRKLRKCLLQLSNETSAGS